MRTCVCVCVGLPLAVIRRLYRCVDVVDLSASAEPWSLARLLRRVAAVIFPEATEHAVTGAIASTWNPNPNYRVQHVVLENAPALASMEAGHVDPSTSQCLFVQVRLGEWQWWFVCVLYGRLRVSSPLSLS